MLGGARGDHADAARGGRPGRHRQSDEQGQANHQQGDAQELVPGRRGTAATGRRPRNTPYEARRLSYVRPRILDDAGLTGRLIVWERWSPEQRRGINENINRLIREYCLEGTDFDAAGDERAREVYGATNRRPRKRHGFRTPYEVHHSQALHLL